MSAQDRIARLEAVHAADMRRIAQLEGELWRAQQDARRGKSLAGKALGVGALFAMPAAGAAALWIWVDHGLAIGFCAGVTAVIVPMIIHDWR